MSKKLPESIQREAKLLCRLAKSQNGIIKVPNLSTAQYIVSKIKGKTNTFDALVPASGIKIDVLNLALAVGQAMNDYAVRAWYDGASDDLLLYICSKDLKEFRESCLSISGGTWEEAHAISHTQDNYYIGISFKDYKENDEMPTVKDIFSLAIKLFESISEKGGFMASHGIENRFDH